MAGEFKLSAILRGHEEDVRAVAFPSRARLISASRDSTVREWTLKSPSPPLYDDTIALQASDWINALAISPPSKQHPEGLIAAGGKETIVYVKQPGTLSDQDPYRILPRHAHNVSCLAFSADGSKLISGGWDSQVFVWDVEAGDVIAELAGHTMTVWGILVYDEKYVFTACADKMIRMFDINGKALRTIKGHTDVPRCFCKIPEGHWSGAAFASAGNDEVIRLWSLDGAAMGELHGHEAYIYSIAILSNGDIVSSGEDRTVRVFRDMACIQTITHPAISIWSVASCPETGDIVSGASDKTIRIFTRDSERFADAETTKAFEEGNKMYAIPAESLSQDAPFAEKDLPGPEALQTQFGERDGQQLFVRELDGSVTAHLWASARGQWDLIGTVVQGEGSGSAKKEYNGKQYDYVFDIDIEEGKPPLKLPYNLTESSWEAARKFLESNELPMTYYEQVANWIADNTRGARIGQGASAAPASSGTAAPARDPWGSENRYRPGDAASGSGGRKLPQRSFITIVEGNPANAINLIIDKAKATNDLSEEDVKSLQGLSAQLQNKDDPHPSTAQITSLLKIVTSWPPKGRVPAVGVLAVCAVSQSFLTATSSGNGTILDTLTSAGILKAKQETPNNVVHGIRTLVNIFKTDAGRLIADGTFDTTLQAVRNFASEPESPAQAKALASLYLNYAVLLTSSAPADSSSTREARAEVLMRDIAFMLESDSPHAAEADALYRALAALGTLITLGGDFRQQMKMGISGTLHVAGMKPGAQRQDTRELMAEIRDELR
ncbi:hypothetical protein B0A48_15823 [Cryoendolithus antarcticus]|uniref:Phospholipase A-2-activating protein n=1 Tax=Cryoendolithus antarcticus TaxID=1507870 RepID=A0A1V8SI69_9PEZI|nr:hypothetical protein B0A48_15823 [Cryoendolithus antarcticus]